MSQQHPVPRRAIERADILAQLEEEMSLVEWVEWTHSVTREQH